MKKKWRTIVAGVALTAAIAAGGTALYVGEKGTTSAYALTAWSEYDGETKTFGQSFTVPERTVTVGDKTVTADSVVIFPDGSATKEKQITLSVSGIYKIIYSAEVDGKPYADEVTFRVDDGAYFFSGGQSSASFGKYQYAERRRRLACEACLRRKHNFQYADRRKQRYAFRRACRRFCHPRRKRHFRL